ncbi:MAG: hypothetical protein ACYTJ0_17380, partial [Planctomycetota bacterium]
MKTLGTMIVGAACLGAASAASADFYTLPVGEGWIEGISNDGVGSGADGFGDQYWMWTVEDGPMQIGGTSPGNGIGGQGKISDDGSRISGTYLNPKSGVHEFSYYDVALEAWVPLSGIGDACSQEMSSGWSISGDGSTVVGLGWLGCGDAHATIWKEGMGPSDLGSTVADRSSRANGVDQDGNVVVGWQDSSGGFRQGAVWVDGVQELIFDNGGDPVSEAFAVSADGQWVTGFRIGPFFGPPPDAYRYNTVTNVYEDIPNLASGGQSRIAGTAVSSDGSTIFAGTWPLGPATFGTAIIWREGIGTMRFDDYLDSIGVEYPAGFEFNFVSAMSANGQWIAGWGRQGGGGTQ